MGAIALRGPVVQFGVHAGLSSRRSRVQIPSGPPLPLFVRALRGRVAQLAERAPEKREVTGSTPVPTTEKAQVRGVGRGACIVRAGFRAPPVLHRNWFWVRIRASAGRGRVSPANAREPEQVFVPGLNAPRFVPADELQRAPRQPLSRPARPPSPCARGHLRSDDHGRRLRAGTPWPPDDWRAQVEPSVPSLWPRSASPEFRQCDGPLCRESRLVASRAILKRPILTLCSPHHGELGADVCFRSFS